MAKFEGVPADKGPRFGAPANAPKPAYGWGTGMLGSVGRGMTAGLHEKPMMSLETAIGAAMEPEPSFMEAWRQRYNQAVAQHQAKMAGFQQAHPVAGTAAEIGGGLVTAPLLAARLPQVSRPFLASIPLGGTSAAIYGGATSPAGQEAQAAAEAIPAGMVAGPAGYTLGMLGGKSLAGLNYLRGKISPQASAAELFRRQVMGPQGLTAADVAGRMRQAGMSPLEATGAPGTRMAQGIMSRSRTGAGRLEQALRARESGTWQRLQNDMRRLLGGREGSRYYRIMRRVQTGRAQRAAPYYDEAFKQDAPPQGVELLNDRYKTLLTSGDPELGVPAQNNAPLGSFIRQTMKKLKTAPEAGEDWVTNIGELDNVKHSIDRKISTALRQGDKKSARILIAMKKDLTTMADEASPAYRQARSIYSLDSENLDAMEIGKKILREDAEITGMQINEMTDAQRDHFLVGASKAIRDAAGTKGPRYFTGRNRHLLREKIENAFPTREAANEFITVSARREGRVAELVDKVLEGSQTELRQSAAEQLGEALTQSSVSPHPTDVARLGWSIKRFLQGKMPDDVADKAVDLLTTQKPDEFLEMVGTRLHLEDMHEIERLIRTGGAIIGGAQAGGVQ